MYFERREFDLTQREQAIMIALWDSEKDLTNGEIAELVKKQGIVMSNSSVTQITKKLIKRGFAEVVGMQQTGNVYSRTLRPIISKDDYISVQLEQLKKIISSNDFVGSIGVFQMLMGRNVKRKFDKSEVIKLQEILRKAEQELEENEK